MDSNTNSLNWFEIPATDLARAKHFYQMIFSIHMDDMNMDDTQMAMFPYAENSGRASGALVKSEYHTPSMDGALVYLNANPAMDNVLEKIEAEGGQILMGKTQISPEYGYMAFFRDTEGNRVGLHSQE